MRKLIINLLFNNHQRYLIREALRESRWRKDRAIGETFAEQSREIFKMEQQFDYKKDIYK